MEVINTLSDPVIILGSLFLAKHIIADGPLQFDYMAYGKTHIGHLGGFAHAACHGVCTLIVLLIWLISGYVLSWEFIFKIVLLDMVIHYTVDICTGILPRKMAWTKRIEDKETGKSHRLVTDRRFYWVLVVDQSIHFLTYLFLTILVLSA
ncbi:MAG: DUF3307 domain-containing protein [Alphaproteobacteria bacterium]|nr:DUF3307 domain-containing protein [Alphaproteobacteria bacterium]MDD9919803.1 DUF3307 domain-containing protein [Alphaproteobacteria bacterium]